MDTKILLLLVLGVSLLAFGCAAKKAPTEEVENETPAEEPAEPEAAPEEPEEPETPPAEEPVSEDMQDLADLFTVKTDRPLEDEGFDVETPASEE